MEDKKEIKPFWEFISLEEFTERFEDDPHIDEDHILIMWDLCSEFEFEDEEQARSNLIELQNQVIDYLSCLEQFSFAGPKYVGRTRTYFKGYVEAIINASDSAMAAKVMADFLNRIRMIH